MPGRREYRVDPPAGGPSWVVIGALISLSAALARLLPDTDPITSGWHSAATFVLLAVMFGLAEVYVLHVQVKREAQTVALSEIPLVLGLTFAAPTLLVGALVWVPAPPTWCTVGSGASSSPTTSLSRPPTQW